MARVLTLTAKMIVEATYTNALDNSTPTDSLNFIRSNVLSTGTASDKADRMYDPDRVTIAPAGTTSLDLSGALNDSLGQSLVFVKIRGLAISNRETTTGINLQVGGNANPFSTWLGAAADVIIVPPGGLFLLTSPIDGYVVTAATGDILDITNSSGVATATCEIIIWGTSA